MGGTKTPPTQGWSTAHRDKAQRPAWGHPSQGYGVQPGEETQNPQLGSSSSLLGKQQLLTQDPTVTRVGDVGGCQPQGVTGGHPGKAQTDTQHPRGHRWVLGKVHGQVPAPRGTGTGTMQGTNRHPAPRGTRLGKEHGWVPAPTRPRGEDTGSGQQHDGRGARPPRGLRVLPKRRAPEGGSDRPGGGSDRPGGGSHLPAPPAAPRRRPAAAAR